MAGRLRLGQTSVVFFLSKVLASTLGFVATVYIARLLGAGALGVYSVALAAVSWLAAFGTMGLSASIEKRVSEEEEPASYAAAGVSLLAVLFVVLSTAAFLFRARLNAYVGFRATGYVVAMLAVTLAHSTAMAVLNGRRLVHLSGIFSPIKTGTRAGLQIGALGLGLGIAGLFGGYILAYLLVTIAASFVALRSLGSTALPQRQHFVRLLSFAKYAWLGGLRARAFNWVDIAVLGFFVQSSFVGLYTAAWNIASFLIIFGSSISNTLFPEMSKRAVEDDDDRVSTLLNDALSFAGLIMIPGLAGGALIGSRLLRIYGPEFTRAGLVLTVLIVATLLQSYHKQLTTALNAIDRADKAFRVNLVFLVSNLVLNIVLVFLFGWVGAAVATAASVGISLAVAYFYSSALIAVSVPTGEIGRQVISAGVMAAVLVGILRLEPLYEVLGNFVTVVSLVSLGATVYFLVLFALSRRFRITVIDNVPVASR